LVEWKGIEPSIPLNPLAGHVRPLTVTTRGDLVDLVDEHNPCLLDGLGNDPLRLCFDPDQVRYRISSAPRPGNHMERSF